MNQAQRSFSFHHPYVSLSGIQAMINVFLLFISNPVCPTPVPSLAIPLSHKGNHREGFIASE